MSLSRKWLFLGQNMDNTTGHVGNRSTFFTENCFSLMDFIAWWCDGKKQLRYYTENDIYRLLVNCDCIEYWLLLSTHTTQLYDFSIQEQCTDTPSTHLLPPIEHNAFWSCKSYRHFHLFLPPTIFHRRLDLIDVPGKHSLCHFVSIDIPNNYRRTSVSLCRSLQHIGIDIEFFNWTHQENQTYEYHDYNTMAFMNIHECSKGTDKTLHKSGFPTLTSCPKMPTVISRTLK